VPLVYWNRQRMRERNLKETKEEDHEDDVGCLGHAVDLVHNACAC
jgi:hypothetical protein